MILDDDVLRVGSSNFNNRSLRLDTGCDIVIDAGIGANSSERTTIASIRNSLMTEHLGTSCETIEQTLRETGSIIATIEKLGGGGRTLRRYEVPDLGTVQTWLADNKILDPEGPGEMFESVFQRRDLLHRLGGNRRLRKGDGRVNPLFFPSIISGGLVMLGVAAIAVRLKKFETARRLER